MSDAHAMPSPKPRPHSSKINKRLSTHCVEPKDQPQSHLEQSQGNWLVSFSFFFWSQRMRWQSVFQSCFSQGPTVRLATTKATCGSRGSLYKYNNSTNGIRGGNGRRGHYCLSERKNFKLVSSHQSQVGYPPQTATTVVQQDDQNFDKFRSKLNTKIPLFCQNHPRCP